MSYAIDLLLGLDVTRMLSGRDGMCSALYALFWVYDVSDARERVVSPI
jgi:hypothetical protein